MPLVSLLRRTALEPIVTAPLLLALTRGSPELRATLLRPLSYLPFAVSPSSVIATLKWLLALGLLRRLSAWLDWFALNGWRRDVGGAAWDFPREVAAVTGGSSGIGRAIVKKLADTGMKVAVVDLQPLPSDLDALPNVHYYECDVTSADGVNDIAARITAELGAPTILCNNAGTAQKYGILEQPVDKLNQIMQINLICHWYTVQAFLPGMLAAKKGHIVATASLASFTNMTGASAYCVAKAGVMSFHEGLTQELKHLHRAPWVKTSIVHPSWTDTPLLDRATRAKLAKRAARMTSRFSLMAPEYIAEQVTGAIFGERPHGQIILPPNLSFFAALRALPWWAQEALRDGARDVTEENGAKEK